MQNQFVMGMCRYGMDCCALFHVVYSGVHESYLTYGITVSGSMSDTKLKKLFLAQKKIIRVLFGEREKFKDKFKTCVRARPYQEQKQTFIHKVEYTES